MRYNGVDYRRTKNVVTLPAKMWLGGLSNHAMFGRVCDESEKGAVLTFWIREDGSKVWAIPVRCKGHSLTNVMYGTDGYMYAFVRGLCYVRGYKRHGFRTGSAPFKLERPKPHNACPLCGRVHSEVHLLHALELADRLDNLPSYTAEQLALRALAGAYRRMKVIIHGT